MSDDKWLIILIFLIVLFTAGTPDLLDSVIKVVFALAERISR